ncbi:alpha/beta hydrolase [Gracilibacillus kekensis]|uniref:Acetyl esterase/lipase n=1 Tax=Gracilibacillus kekensis TaxID=1027249 RepID=A0A1M7PKV5_9BACI|nr:alpha/beta hydrolase [Gracilibacillus kekensis]SHN17772.1 Acetyl esterase/lipase [Gracilibacillus kekensis]
MKKFNFDYPVTEKIYKTVEKRELKLFIFESELKQQVDRPAILFFNGASFKKDPKSPVQFQHQANYFSSEGMVAICVDYRNGSDEGFLPTQAICDVKSAVRWIRRNASEWGVSPNKIVVCGSSAGAYIAVSSIMFDDLNDEQEYDNKRIKHVPDALVVFAGVMDGVDIMSRRYPELLDIAIDISPIHNIKKCLPQTLWLCGTSDLDYENNQEFIKLMKQEGNEIKLKTFKGMEHGFFNYGRHLNQYFHLTNYEIVKYLHEIKIIM